MPAKRLRVVLLKPSKYDTEGWVDRFRVGFMPNSTLHHMRGLTPSAIGGAPIEVHTIDEYVEPNTSYLSLLEAPDRDTRVLLGLVGVQSHQFHRALDLAAWARRAGALAVIGGPHPMTCDTTDLQGRGVSFAMSEAEQIWHTILNDTIEHGELQSVYGGEQRWSGELDPPPIPPPSRHELRRYVMRMFGVYPARGCPYRCVFCSIVKIAGHQVRSQPTETTLATLRAAKAAGARVVIFTSDNFNKFAGAWPLLEAMVEERIELPFFVQCDAQVVHQPEFVELLARAGCYQMLIGAESFDRKTLLAAQKPQNHPEHYVEIVRTNQALGISTQLSNIIGFPQDTPESIAEHRAKLLEIGPEAASFYVLTPLPGTEQYDALLAEGRITERNLDRYDMTTATWSHPTFSGARLVDLVYESYLAFYRFRSHFPRALRCIRRAQPFVRRLEATTLLPAPLFMQRSARRREHPMSGGIGHVRADHLSAYLPLRRSFYDLELVSLPKSLTLSEHDEALNRAARLDAAARPSAARSHARKARDTAATMQHG